VSDKGCVAAVGKGQRGQHKHQILQEAGANASSQSVCHKPCTICMHDGRVHMPGQAQLPDVLEAQECCRSSTLKDTVLATSQLLLW
jgi:hypothetical protein